ncbi:uncharacterized protein [Aegilops tauschii subsp. strangulata]|uniref:uncharacterized protein n=1 Tax=Aegilops tauschii subsp. strangulata TaxID=200361 RepID=UPI003CC8BFF0
MVWLLDNPIDTKHRAYMMREKEMKLEPLKIRYHGVSGPAMPYDERYTPYIKQAGLLPWIQLVNRSTPNLNAPLVSALADRWRPETHSFHLQTREMTVTLEDVSLITGLAIDGMPLCMSTDSDEWREQMIALIGSQIGHALVVICFYFLYGAGSVCLLDARRFNPWYEDEDDDLRRPTWAYKWDVVSEMTNDVNLMYQKYVAELDTITPEQVEWQPYGADDRLGYTPEFSINPMCLRDRDLWLATGLLSFICHIACFVGQEKAAEDKGLGQASCFVCYPLPALRGAST